MAQPIRIDRRLKRCRDLLSEVEDLDSKRALLGVLVHVGEGLDRGSSERSRDPSRE